MLTLVALALALAMDAFAAALCQGAGRPGVRHAIVVGLAFGVAQGLMPLAGWGLGAAFAGIVRHVDHWIAFALLVFLGLRMAREGLAREPDDCAPPLAGWALVGAAIATSVDAAAAGVTLPLLGVPVWLACLVIGSITAALCAAGVLLGALAGARFGRGAAVAGGAALVLLGAKILVDHLFFGD